jgi:transcriptional regulator with XRE-family HTH domain
MITTAQIRAARGMLNWSQSDLSEKTGISATSIGSIENGITTARDKTNAKIREAFEGAGIEFIDGGVRKVQNIINIYEGDDCFVRLLEDAYLELYETKGDLLLSSSDERRANIMNVQKLKAIKKAGIRVRSLLEDGNSFYMGKAEDYRWMPKELYIDSDVKVIFNNKVAYLMSWLNVPRVVVIQDQNIANENRLMFEHIWKNSPMPTKQEWKDPTE